MLRQPRIELGAQRWQRWILLLNHWCKVQGMGIEPTTSDYPSQHNNPTNTTTTTMVVPFAPPMMA